MGKLGYWEWDRINDKLVTCSEQFARNYEMSVDEALVFFSKRESDVSVIHPDDKERYKQRSDDSEKQLKGMDIEFSIITRSGAVRHVYLRSKILLDDQNRIIKSFGTEQDITEHKRAEEALRESNNINRALLDAIPDAIFRIDKKGIYLDVRSANDWNTLLPISELPGKTISATLPLTVAQDSMQHIANALQTGTVQLHEYTLEIEGNTRFYEARIARSLADEVLSLVRDITIHKRAEEALETANAELAQAVEQAQELALVADAANRSTTQFLANTSHELRTPLSIIISFLKILNDGLAKTPEQERDFLQIALKNANHLLTVVNDLLNITIVETGRLKINLERVRLADVLDEVKQATGVLAEKKGLALQFDYSPGLFVRVDAARLRQVLLNLVGNAIKFTDSGKVSVNANPAADPDYALIEITDTGVGISPRFMSSAFDKFSQADSSFSRVHGGTGLGLAISRGLVEMMGGEIVLESEGEGRGTRAWLTLPIAEKP